MRKQIIITLFTTATTFLILQFTIGHRYWNPYGWRGYSWHRSYYPPAGYAPGYDHYPYPPNYRGYYAPWEEGKKRGAKPPADSARY